MSPKAKLIIKDRFEFQDGSLVELKLWGVPKSKDKPHGYKYSLVYIVKGKRVIGYDNAEGKGDHKHYVDNEILYNFKNINELIKDFLKDINKIRGGDQR